MVNKFVNQNDLDIIISGSGDVNLKEFAGKDISIDIEGSGDISLGSCETTENLSVVIEGSGEVKALADFESLNKLKVSIIGSGDYYGFPIEANNCNVSIMGSGDCKLTALENLDIIINGSGDVYYKGSPAINQTINGSGSVISSN